jgi:hypothetical protein
MVPPAATQTFLRRPRVGIFRRIINFPAATFNSGGYKASKTLDPGATPGRLLLAIGYPREMVSFTPIFGSARGVVRQACAAGPSALVRKNGGRIADGNS